MKKIIIMSAVTALALGAQAASSYLYWMLDEPTEMEFAYARVLGMSEGGETSYLTIAEPGGGENGMVFNQNVPELGYALGGQYYSLIPEGTGWKNFYVELYSWENAVVGVSQSAAYADLVEKFVYSDMSTSGIRSPYHFTAAIPEPSCGLLFLLGVGLLALRRRQSHRRALAAIAGMLLVGNAFAAADDMVLSFSTPGVDRYADGSRVREGESYALVWTAKGATFGGLTAECGPVAETDKLVLVASLAKRGRCPVTVLEISAEDAKQYENGTFALYLLDTRMNGADGKVAVATYVNGRPQVVNLFGASDADANGVAVAAGVAGSINGASAVKLGEVGVYSEIEPPVITALKIEGATIRLEVKGMSKAADYFVVPGDTPGSFAPAMNAQADDDGFTFEKPETPATFYKVIGVRK